MDSNIVKNIEFIVTNGLGYEHSKNRIKNFVLSEDIKKFTNIDLHRKLLTMDYITGKIDLYNTTMHEIALTDFKKNKPEDLLIRLNSAIKLYEFLKLPDFQYPCVECYCNEEYVKKI